MLKNFKLSHLLFVGLLASGSSLNAGLFDDVTSAVTGKVATKSADIVENKMDKADKKVDSVLDSNGITDKPKEVQTQAQTAATAATVAAPAQGQDKIGQLKELIQMKKEGYLNEEEFAREKAKLQL
jgi:hypothetical protein